MTTQPGGPAAPPPVPFYRPELPFVRQGGAITISETDPHIVKAVEGYWHSQMDAHFAAGADAQTLLGDSGAVQALLIELRNAHGVAHNGGERAANTCAVCDKVMDDWHEPQAFFPNQDAYAHEACASTLHPFLRVDFDGHGGPTLPSQEEVDAFIQAEIENPADPDEPPTRADFTVKPEPMTWRKYYSLREFDGY
jgi:hypothetical protein